MKRAIWVIGLVIFTAAVAVLAVGLTGRNTTGAVAVAGQQTVSAVVDNQHGIWVSGEGEVPVTPDIAILNLGVTAQASTVAAAQSQAAEAMDKVMSALTSNGVDQKDIQTQYFSIQQLTPVIPPVPYNSPSETSSVSANGTSLVIPVRPPGQLITGYEVSNVVTVKIRAIDNTGSIIDAVVAAGGDLLSINEVTFSVDQPDQYYAQARQLAMNDAKAKANQLAELAGVTLGTATYISESSSTPILYPPQAFSTQAVASSATTPINPGQTDIIVDVQVAYAIQ
jgi:uncharacterized protein YggE